ncbi:Tetratricopeptide-like helical [Penicillium cf. viridicatum]|uniref:Tetratricopeptide-like helical n=1 Tax=Penicillium cf. viridicatum TaxID=2972119 RepID=A0A9W9J1I5_9EURO|nr:Tetratricopeptide-like helical [Penicillium cf. viridicatum]
MARISDLIRDSKLETYFLPDCTVETVHRFLESDSTSGQRLVTRSEHWRRQEKIGKGGFGSVWLEKCTKGGRPGAIAQEGAVRAVKQIDIDRRFGPVDYNRELEAIAKFSHSRYERCFVKSFGWYEGPSQLFISMEYLEIGDLFTYLHKKGPVPPLPEIEAKEIAYQVLDGLSMMHENGFAHRDLKPHNILIKSYPPHKWWIKLADFGITKRIEESHGQPTTTLQGTPEYFAPEIWGFVKRGSAYTLLTDAGISQQGVEFVLSFMCPYPNERITATSAMSNVWIQSLILRPPESTKAIKDEPRIPSPATISTEEFASWNTKPSSEARKDVFHDERRIPSPATTMTEEFASWNTKPSLEARKDVFHDIPSSTATVEPASVTQGNTAQRKTSYYSPRNTVPAEVETLGLHSTEPNSQYQNSRQKWYKDTITMSRRALQGREKTETLDSEYWLGLSLYEKG